MIYTITSNNETLAKYKEYYFNKYPNRRVFPIDTPIHPSMNVWIKMQSFKQDSLKKAWGEYAEWLVEYHGYKNLMIEKCSCRIEIYKPTKRRFDLDNHGCLKFFNDGLVKAGLIIDDDVNHLNPVTIYGGYDKENPRMEVHFFVGE